MIKKLEYILLDSSQLVDLIKLKKTSIITTPNFNDTFGLPFITLHQLVEIAKIGDLNHFTLDLRTLSNCGTFYTSSPFGTILPIHISNLFSWELDCIRKGIVSIDDLRSKFYDTIQTTYITQDPVEIELLFEHSKGEAQASGIVSLLNTFEFNKYKNYKPRELAKIDFSDNEANVALEAGKKNISDFINCRIKKKTQALELISSIQSIPNITWDLIKPFSNIEDFWKNQLGKDFNPEETIDRQFERYEFHKIKKLYTKQFSIDYSEVENIQIEDTNLFRFKIENRKLLHNELFKDKERKIESGNEIDLDLLIFSFFMKVFADKRIFEFVNKYLGKFPYRDNIIKTVNIADAF